MVGVVVRVTGAPGEEAAVAVEVGLTVPAVFS